MLTLPALSIVQFNIYGSNLQVGILGGFIFDVNAV